MNQTDPTAAIEVLARLLCAADGHVHDGDHPTWHQLSVAQHGRGQDDYRKAARWLLPRMTVATKPASSAGQPARADAALRDRIAGTLLARIKQATVSKTQPFDAVTALLAPTEFDLADAVLAVLPEPPSRAESVCICGHPERQHFEDVCITEITGCHCGDFLPVEAAAEEIARLREIVRQKPPSRAAVLREAIDVAREQGHRLEQVAGIEPARGARSVAYLLRKLLAKEGPRRVADEAQPAEAQQQPETEAPWVVQKICCGHDDGTAEFATWEAADSFREVYIDSARIAGHERSAIIRRNDAPAPVEPAAADSEETREAPVFDSEAYLAIRCDACRHTLIQHENYRGCTVALCVCSRFQWPVEERA